jgi:6-bladed beta-propeller
VLKRLIVSIAAVAVLVTAAAIGQAPTEKGGENETGPYDVVTGWPQNYCGAGHVIGSTGGIWAESPDRVYIFNRGCLPEVKEGRGAADSFIPSRNASGYDMSQKDPSRHPRWDHVFNVVNRDGKLIESWDQHNKMFVRPHRVLQNPYDAEKHVWLIDDGAHAIYKFSNDGKKLVMTVGTPMTPGNDQTHFNRPTDIAWLPDGTFFVSDGYVNTRVVKFDKDGRFLMTWGTKGNGPGQFDLPHSIDIDRNRRVYVADRSNSRIQIFDENGQYLDQWPNIRQPFHIMISADQHLWVVDGMTNKFLKYDLNGKLLYSWGTYGTFPGAIWGVHQFSVDSAGNLYAAETFGGRTQKFRPRPGADPAKLVGAPVPLMTNR